MYKCNLIFVKLNRCNAVIPMVTEVFGVDVVAKTTVLLKSYTFFKSIARVRLQGSSTSNLHQLLHHGNNWNPDTDIFAFII